jgi:cation/acetate symporter
MDSVQIWSFIIVGASFALYIGIAIWSRASSTKEFYVAGGNINPLINGMATGADWMSAASFLSMAGMISFMGRDGSVYLMGWTGGYVLLALLLAPYLRKFGKFTVPDFVGERYYSRTARLVAVFAAIFVSFTYVAGQMRGVGIVFSRFLNIDINTGVIIGMLLVLFYAVTGGMKGITYTQVAQYIVLIFAYMVPAIFISFMLTGNPVPQLGMGSKAEDGAYLIDKLNHVLVDLGFLEYTKSQKPVLDVIAITAALMIGTAGLPHVIVRFFTVPKVSDARKSAGYALFFIALLYTTAPAVAVFARYNLIDTVNNASYSLEKSKALQNASSAPKTKEVPGWFKKWETTGLIAWIDKNNDGVIQYKNGDAIIGKPLFKAETGTYGQRILTNEATKNANELYVDNDIMVLANPEIAKLPAWVIALVAAGGLAAALSTAAGLLLVISTSVSHDMLKMTFIPNLSEKGELLAARFAAAGAVIIAGYFGINPPGFVAQVVAFAFGLAASSFFPVIILGIFTKRMNKEGAIAGMLSGITFTAAYILYFKFINPAANVPSNWLFGISPEGIGTVGMFVNFGVALIVSRLTPPPPEHIQHMIEDIRIPRIG